MALKRKFSSRKRVYRKKSYRRPKSALMRPKKLRRVMKRAIVKMAEPKCKRTAIANTDIYHNTFGYRILLNQTSNMPAQGVADTMRVGDQINLTGFKLKLFIEQKADRPNVTWKYYVLKVPKGSTYNYGAWFESTTGNVLLDDANKDFVKVLTSGTWRPNQASLASDANERSYSFTKKLWVSRKKIVKFGPADAAVTHNDDDIYLLLAGFDAYGTLVTDILGNAQTLVEVYYRDP